MPVRFSWESMLPNPWVIILQVEPHSAHQRYRTVLLPVNVDDFIKKTSIISYSRQALEKVHNQIETFAKSEGLTAHANSIKVRFED